MNLIQGGNKKTPNHFGCLSCAANLGSQIPQYREFTLRNEVRVASRDGVTVEYDRPFYQCNTCDSCITTPEQAEGAIENMEFALYEIEIVREFDQ